MAVILVTLGIIVGTLIFGDILRNLVINPMLSDGLLKSLLMDVVLTFELCGSSFEMGIIFQYYGLTVWTIGVFLTCLFQLIRWRGLEVPSTHTHLLDWISGKKSLFETILRNLTIMAVGLMTYRFYNTTIWDFELSMFHNGRSLETSAGICVSPWENVPIIHSVISEFIGTCLLGIAIRLVVDNPTLANNDPMYSVVILSTIICVAIHGCLHFSGGLFNPMLATVLFGGCLGHSNVEHFIIYWVGSTSGAVLGHLLYPSLQKRFYPVAQKDKKA